MTNGHWEERRKKEAQAKILYAEGKTQEADYLLGKHLGPGYIPVSERVPELSSNIITIINLLENGKLLYPDWFQNNINWVKDGHMSEQEFLTSYDYLSDQGLIHPPVEQEQMVQEILLSANVKISFTDSNIGGFSSSIPIGDIGDLQALSNASNEWKYTLIGGGSTNPPLVTLNGLINDINNLLASVVPEVEPEVPEQMQFLCSDVYTLDNGSVVKTNYPTLSVPQIQNFISQGLMVRECGTPSPTLSEVRSHYGYVPEPDETVPTEKFVVSKPGRLTMSDMTNTNAWVGVLFAGALAVPVFSSILSKKK